MPRDSVVGRLEQQVMLATGSPGVVLYGRRRMGKSTVLRNLVGFLPAKVQTVAISMQDPQAFTSLASLVVLLSDRLEGVRPGEGHTTRSHGTQIGATRSYVDGEDRKTRVLLTTLFSALSDCNDAAASEGRRIIVALDEYENIDRKIGERVLRWTCWRRCASRSRRIGT